jgi:hypothetical protein
MQFDKSGNLRIEGSESNAASLLGAMFDEKTLYHDVRNDLYMFKGKCYSDTQLVNMFLPMIQSATYGLGLEKFRKSAISGGLEVLMSARARDPHAEYLKALVWDGVPRVESFFAKYVGAEDSEYIRRVSKNFWTALAARGVAPGTKFDVIVILEGDEGLRKSTLVESIGHQYTFVSSKKDAMDNEDELRKMHQAIIVEFPELLGILHQDGEKVKGFLSMKSDHMRSLYAKKAMDIPRGFVFVGTTNSKRYLRLEMGSRRYWPVTIPKGKRADINAIGADRDQLFAEGLHHFREKFECWAMPNELLDPVTQGKQVGEALDMPIRSAVASFEGDFTVVDIYRHLEAGGFIARGLTSAIKNRIEGVLSRHAEMYVDSANQERWKKRSAISQFTDYLKQMVGPQTLEALI